MVDHRSARAASSNVPSRSAEQWLDEFNRHGGLTDLELDEKTIAEVRMSWMLLCAKKGSVGAAEEAIMKTLRKSSPEMATILYGAEGVSMNVAPACGTCAGANDINGILSGSEPPLLPEEAPAWFVMQFAAQHGRKLQQEQGSKPTTKKSRSKSRTRQHPKEVPEAAGERRAPGHPPSIKAPVQPVAVQQEGPPQVASSKPAARVYRPRGIVVSL